MTQTCLTNGSWYWEACGPMPAGGSDVMLPWSEWSRQPWQYHAGFHELDARIIDSHAATIKERGEELGQADLSQEAILWIEAATTWINARDRLDATAMYRTVYGESEGGKFLGAFVDDTDPVPTLKAAAFTYHACRVARSEARRNRGEDYLAPQDFFTHASGSFERYSTHYLYTTCRRHKYNIFTDPGRAFHGFLYDLTSCAQDKVTCKKEEIMCSGSCAGVDGASFNHDFATVVSLAELDEEVLGTEAFTEGAAADCNVRTHVFEVPTFAGGDSFKTVFARLQTRSGMTALDTGWCETNPLSCGVIQRVLERSPGLVYVNGQFRHSTLHDHSNQVSFLHTSSQFYTTAQTVSRKRMVPSKSTLRIPPFSFTAFLSCNSSNRSTQHLRAPFCMQVTKTSGRAHHHRRRPRRAPLPTRPSRRARRPLRERRRRTSRRAALVFSY